MRQPLKAVSALALALCLIPAASLASIAPKITLAAFTSDAEIVALFRKWAEQQRDRRAARAEGQSTLSAEAPAAPPAAQASAKAEDSITNVQHAGVDEGGIVKVHGNHLVILRRGRLFTVAVDGQRLAPVASIDAYAPGADPRGTWYDEMLVSGNLVVVIGFSYARGGTEVGVFEISPHGHLAYKSTYHLRSNDYYSARNYASRLIGTKLVLYSPLHVSPHAPDPLAALPAVRRWYPQATPADFKRLPPARRIYRADDAIDPAGGLAFHSVTLCDVAQPELACESTAVLGPAGRVFYVSPSAVYVWATPWPRSASGDSSSVVYRIPLDASAPSALKVAGSPIDQLSFLEGADGWLNVLVRSHGRGDGMWASEFKGGTLALLRVALSSFSDGRDAAPIDAYLRLPTPAGHSLQNRYVGRYLLYGAGAGWHRPQTPADANVYALDFASGRAAFALPLNHSVDRIEALGRHAVVVGSDGKDLHFTSLQLGVFPIAVSGYVRRNAAQGETRTHGFFYKPEGEDHGLLGLPVLAGDEGAARQLRRPPAAVLFVRNSALKLTEIGALHASVERSQVNDNCKASCVDWYGNARPIFLRGRMFALMGYEIVEGRVGDASIEEVRRASFAPSSLQISVR
jgi:hypothetical protein